MALLMLILKKLIDPFRFYGPIVAAIIIAIIIDQFRGTVYFTLAPMLAVLAPAIYYGGTLGGSIVGLIIVVYSLYASPNLNIIRAAIIIGSVVAIIVPFAFMRSVFDNADTIRSELRDIDIQMTGIIDRWPRMPESDKRDTLNRLRYQVRHVLTLTAGWLELIREKDDVIRKSGRK